MYFVALNLGYALGSSSQLQMRDPSTRQLTLGSVRAIVHRLPTIVLCQRSVAT